MEANIEIRKKKLQNWLSNLKEESIIVRLEQLKQENLDWWDIIGEEEKEAINEGITQLDNGEYVSHSDMRGEIKRKYGF
jgi:hypothetical protein